jgi:hypothetical protein
MVSRISVPQNPSEPPLLCPSSQPGIENCRVLGVIQPGHQGPEIAWLDAPLPATEDVLRMAAPARPTQIFRLAATCQTAGCPHFDGAACKLAMRIVELLPIATAALPHCHIRRECRWFQQEGTAACRRCSQITTEACNPSAAMRQVIAPVWNES